MRLSRYDDFVNVYPSYFNKLQVCWLRSFTRITYLSKLIGIHSLAAFLQLELLGYRLIFRIDLLYHLQRTATNTHVTVSCRDKPRGKDSSGIP
ncbi:hypothetical protein CWD78_11635 [Dickeya dadantii]|nr:hypothetical protein [Dickeya dadantii]